MSNSSEFVLADDVPGAGWTDESAGRETDGVEDWTAPGASGSRDGGAPGDDDHGTALAGEPSLTEVLRVVFDVGVGEREAYVALVRQQSKSAGDLAEDLDRDRSNVNRYLNNLYQKDLVTRRRRILQSGGHVYEYCARSPDAVRDLLLAGLEAWTDAASDRIDQLVTETDDATEQVPT